MEEQVIQIIVLIGIAGIAAQWLAWRTGLPAIVVLLAVGLAAGPGLGIIAPSETFGAIFHPIIGFGVAIIVFEGGLNLRIRELRAAGTGIFRLIVFAVPLTWLLTTLAGHYIGGLNWAVAALFGAILVVTGPTVIMPLLRQAKLQRRTAAYLKWEGIVNDPIGAVLAVVILEYLTLTSIYRDQEAVLPSLGLRLAGGIAVALALGTIVPLVIRWAFRHDQAPEILKTPILLSSVLAVYAAANTILSETGLIAATVFGVVLGNAEIAGLQELKRFKESLTVFLVSGIFIMLAADLDPTVFQQLSWPIIGTTLAILFVVRPAAIFLATIRDHMDWRERLLLGWIAPRGIVAAAIGGIASSRLAQAGYEGADLILPMVFAVIAATVIGHGFTIGPLARRLGLAAEPRPGLLIVGAWEWTFALAQKLGGLNVPVVIADRSWEALAPARRLGLETHCGELLSAGSEEAVDRPEVEYLLAATDDDAYNALLCSRFAPEFGRERVYQFAPRAQTVHADDMASREWRGQVLVSERLNGAVFADRLAEGWHFQVLTVTAGKDLPPDRDDQGVNVLWVLKDGALEFASPERAQALPKAGTLIRFARAAEPVERGQPAERKIQGTGNLPRASV